MGHTSTEMVGRMNDVTYAKDPARCSISRGCLPTLPPVKSYLISLCLSFLTYKIGTQWLLYRVTVRIRELNKSGTL